VNKNVRVRPVSSLSGGKTRDDSEHNTKHNSSTFDDEDDRKFNMDV
jgi:hypothetical protein